jgi:hypothetical protein
MMLPIAKPGVTSRHAFFAEPHSFVVCFSQDDTACLGETSRPRRESGRRRKVVPCSCLRAFLVVLAAIVRPIFGDAQPFPARHRSGEAVLPANAFRLSMYPSQSFRRRQFGHIPTDSIFPLPPLAQRVRNGVLSIILRIHLPTPLGKRSSASAAFDLPNDAFDPSVCSWSYPPFR